MTRGRWLLWTGVVVCLLLAGGVVVGSSAVGAQSDSVTATVSNDSAWPAFGLRPDGNRALPNGTGPVETGVVQWNYTTGGSVHSSPAVANETLYFGSDDGDVYAFDTRTGVKQWNYSTGDKVLSSPAVTNGTVYVGSHDTNVYALNATDGTERWSYTTGGIVWSSPAVVNGTVYVGNDNNKVYAIDAQTGNEQWNYTTGGKVQSSPAVANGTVYVGSYDNKVYALNATDGTEQWSYLRDTSLGNEISSPAVVNNTVYIGGVQNAGGVYALNATDKTERWTTKTFGEVQSSPTVWNDTVYIGNDNNVSALHTTTGTVLWNYTTTSKVYSTPTVVNGTVYVGSYDNNVSAIDAVNGTELWRYTTGSSVFSSPTVVDGIAYVGSLDDTLYALHADDSVPILSNYTVSNASGLDLVVRFDSDKILTNISVSISDTESATLSTSDFTPTVDTDGNLTYTAVYTAGSEGSYTATLDTATDGAGNHGPTGQQESVVVDTTPPTISAYTVSNPSSQNVTVRFNATEQLPTISVSISDAESATLSASDFTETATNDGNYTYNASYTGSSDGNYTATLDTAADAAGNDGATGQQGSAVVDTTLPTISEYTVSNPSSQNVTVRFNATKQLSTISVSISDAESATLSASDFTETTTNDGNYTYSAVYTGSSDGNYTATLDTAADGAGIDGANGQQDSVIVDTISPTADAGGNQTVDEDTTVQFNGSNSTDNTGIASYNWSFGDGMNATGPTPTHTYTDAGEYTVTLTVEDAAGNQDTNTSTVTVESSGNGGNDDNDNSGGGGGGGGGGGSSATESGSTVTVVPEEAVDSSDSGTSDSGSAASGSAAADSTESRSVAVRGVSRGERVSVDFTTADDDRTATDGDEPMPNADDTAADGDDTSPDGDESTDDARGSDEPTPQQARNVVPDGLDIQFAEAGDYEFTVRTRDADTTESTDSIDSSNAEPVGTDDSGSASRPDLSTNSLDTDGARFARETRQRPVGFIEVDTEFEAEAVETATHRFRVRKSYLDATGASVESVRLYRDEISQWRELDTQQIRETEEYHFFEAETPGFSLFVIGTSAPVFETADQQLVGFDESTGEVEATVSVENIGSEAGIYDAVLSADGEPIGTTEESVPADERAEVTVTGTVETDDPVTLRLAGQSLGEVTRTESVPEGSEDGLVGILVGVVVVVIGGLLWSRRQNDEDS